ncbi:MAG TPA: hypothetical protein VGV92_03935 [Gammaproteobacteria bacterium]|nr:hypothetical protein [Gammaproteobacteria bacterium]
MTKPSEFVYTLIWIAIILGVVLWLGFLFIGLAFNPFALFAGLIFLVIIMLVFFKIYQEQKDDKESEHYSKHIDK